MATPGIIVCSRLDSERLPGKVLRKLNGVPVLVHLLRRLVTLDLPIVIAVPMAQFKTYNAILNCYPELSRIHIFGSNFVDDPLARMVETMNTFKFTHVVRVTHDKIFIDTRAIKNVLAKNLGSDYVFSSSLTPGTGFELISAECLRDASKRFKNVEHISYAVRLTSKNTVNFNSGRAEFPFNLLIDFAEDLKLMEVIFAALGNHTTLDQVINYLRKNPDLGLINSPPIVTVYTCGFNASKFIDKAMESVIQQSDFAKFGEYILIDDHSSDNTCERMAKFAIGKSNVSWYRNEQNIGLSSSSNLALKRARGKYILRLDADDYFAKDNAVMKLLTHAQMTKAEIVYPDNYFGDFKTIQKGNECHHVGGSLFDKKALNHIQFTDGLRHYEGLDLFSRAREQLKIAYFDKPVFFYTQHPKSLSKNNLNERARIKEEILAKASI